jgi:hypothetical protein
MYRSTTMHDHGPDPDEYFEQAGAGAGATPEKRLRLAVLLNAITQLQRGGEHPAAEEAARWVRGEIDAMHVSFSFAAICETLDLDAEHLARAILGTDEREGRSATRLPRRQVRTQRLHGVPRRYRARSRAAAAGE